MLISKTSHQLKDWQERFVDAEDFAKQLKTEIKRHAADPYFGSEQLAAKLEISSCQLNKKCLQLIDQKLGKYILKVRLEIAENLIVATREPLQNIAWNNGFLSYSGFWKAFNKVYGYTPSDYRAFHRRIEKSLKFEWKMPPSIDQRNELQAVIHHNPIVFRTLKAMIKNIDMHRLTLNELVNLLHTSPSTLTKSLTCNMKVTPMRLLQHLRLLFAANLLFDSSKSIAEIAYCAGFFDQSHFSKAFKVAYGSTPNTFRKEGRKEEFFTWLTTLLDSKIEM